MSFNNRYQNNSFNLEADILNKGAYFWYPDYLEASAWTEHVPFAFWLIETFRPKSIVELGVFRGTSYFSFCQAVATLNLRCACYGVDTWTGDEHSGFYSDSLYEKVFNYNDRYSKFSTLIKSTFDEANKYFLDGSIDLLHIDGYHTYEEVKHDFENWLPKLSKNAIVLFHDINVREREFGVFRLWDEITKDRLHTKFDFGHGLGVLATGKDYPSELLALFNEGTSPIYIFLRNFFAERGKLFSRQNTINAIRQEVGELRSTINILQSNLENTNLSNQQLQNEISHLLTVKRELETLKQESNGLKQEVTDKTTAIEEYRNQILQLQHTIDYLNIQNNATRNLLGNERLFNNTNERFLTLKIGAPLKNLIIKKPKLAASLTSFFFKVAWFFRGKLPSKRYKLQFWKQHPEIPYSMIEDYVMVQRSGLFDREWYLTEYPDVKNSGVDPLLHYLTVGFLEGRNPGPHFNTNKYYGEHEDVNRKLINPLTHHLKQQNLFPNIKAV